VVPRDQASPRQSPSMRKRETAQQKLVSLFNSCLSWRNKARALVRLHASVAKTAQSRKAAADDFAAYAVTAEADSGGRMLQTNDKKSPETGGKNSKERRHRLNGGRKGREKKKRLFLLAMSVTLYIFRKQTERAQCLSHYASSSGECSKSSLTHFS
jgi:hypothetical protein